jgi:hypothetical protein
MNLKYAMGAGIVRKKIAIFSKRPSSIAPRMTPRGNKYPRIEK